jgi:DNA-binding NtrC family response regulator
MLNGSQGAFQYGPEAFSPAPGQSLSDPRQTSSSVAEPAPFICISSTLRRLLLHSRMIAARTHIASLHGEPGAGKHLFAQNLHAQSTLADLPFRRADARAWLSTDCEVSSLSGILYLDRVDLLAPTGQNLLLNFVKMLQNDAPRRFLLLVSSHVPLRQLAAQNHFLPDLAFRLSAVQFSLPPLREHREDIASITQELIDRICRRYQQPTAVLAPGTMPRLLQHDWPGNVRELASALESAIVASTTGILRPGDLPLQSLSPHPPLPIPPASESNPSANSPHDLSLDAAIHHHILLVLKMHRGNKLRAARQLGISRSTLYRLLAGEHATL